MAEPLEWSDVDDDDLLQIDLNITARPEADNEVPLGALSPPLASGSGRLLGLRTESLTDRAPSSDRPQTSPPTDRAPSSDRPQTSPPTDRVPSSDRPQTSPPTDHATDSDRPQTSPPTDRATSSDRPQTSPPTDRATSSDRPQTSPPTDHAPSSDRPQTRPPTGRSDRPQTRPPTDRSDRPQTSPPTDRATSSDRPQTSPPTGRSDRPQTSPPTVQLTKVTPAPRPPMRRFGRSGYLWVSDLSTQAWCEQQMEYTFTLPTVYVENPTMTTGSSIHLMRELEVQDSVDVRVTSREDKWAIKLINLVGAINSFLIGVPVRREIPIFGTPFDDDVFMVGLIDEIRVDPETFDFDIFELKTRASSRIPSRAQQRAHHLQVMLYKKLFDDLVKGKVTKHSFAKSLWLKLDKELGEEVRNHLSRISITESLPNLDRLLEFTFGRLQSVPCISQCLVEYCYQEDQSTIAVQAVPYDEPWLRDKVTHYLAYWKGQRATEGVDIEDAWKCVRCEFADVCDWRRRKESECKGNNAVNMHQ